MAYFSNKISLITGAASGIGRLMALKIAARGSHVVLWDVDDAGLTMVAEEIAEAGNEASTYYCDVSDRDMVYSTAAKVREEVGRVDILINNAGIVSGRPFLECTDEQLGRTMAVNILAHFWNEGARELHKFDPAIPEYSEIRIYSTPNRGLLSSLCVVVVAGGAGGGVYHSIVVVIAGWSDWGPGR